MLDESLLPSGSCDPSGFVAVLLVSKRWRVLSNRLIRTKSTLPTHLQKSLRKGGFFVNGGPCWIRTSDQLVKSQLLYQLS
jgi:hypothetical protein